MDMRSYRTPLANKDLLAPDHTRKVSARVISMDRGMLIGHPTRVMIHPLVCVKSCIGFICGNFK